MKKTDDLGLVKQGSILAIAALLVRVIGFAYKIPLVNMLGDEGMGYYTNAFQIYAFLLILSSYGIPVSLSKMISERYQLKQYYNAQQVFNTALKLCVPIGVGCSLFLWFGADIFAKLYDMPNIVYSMKALAPTITLVAFMSVLRGYFQGMSLMKPTAISQIIEQIFNAFFSVLLVWLFVGNGLEYGSAGGTLGTGLGSLFGLIFLVFLYAVAQRYMKHKVVKSKTKFRRESTKSIIKQLIITCIPIIAPTAIISTISIVDVVMLNKLTALLNYSSEHIKQMDGILNGKFVTLTNLPISIATAMATASVPSISASIVKKDKKSVNNKINTAIRLILLISLPSAVGLIILGSPILHMLFPSSPDGGILFKYGSISIVFFSLSYIGAGVLQGINKIIVPVKNTIIGAVIKIIFNYIFIYVFDLNYLGPVISTNIFSFVVAFLNIYAVLKYAHIKMNFKFILVKPLISTVFMGLYCYLFYNILLFILKSNTFACLISVVLSIFLYFLILININGVTDEELKSLKFGGKILRKLKIK